MKALFTSLILFAQSAPPPPPECHLKTGVAIGCNGDQHAGAANAADFFDRYRFATARILNDDTQAYLSRFSCFRVFDRNRGLHFSYYGRVAYATPNGVVNVRWVSVDKRWFWVAEPYFDGPCPPTISKPERETIPLKPN